MRATSTSRTSESALTTEMPDTVQTAGGFVGLAVELAAGMELGHDDFKRRLARRLRMLLDRDAATIVRHGQEAFGVEAHFDEIGVSRNGFVHRVVDDFGEEVVQRLFVRAADIHAGAHADGFEDLRERGSRTRRNRRRSTFGGAGGAGTADRIGKQRRARCRRATSVLRSAPSTALGAMLAKRSFELSIVPYLVLKSGFRAPHGFT